MLVKNKYNDDDDYGHYLQFLIWVGYTVQSHNGLNLRKQTKDKHLIQMWK